MGTILLFVMAFLWAGAGVWFVLNPLPRESRAKIYDRDLAEDVRVWNPKTGVDLIRLKSCRLEKRRSGPIAFGGLNVLRIDDLVLNLPFPREEKAVACEGGREFVQVGDLSDTLFGNGRLPYGKASGIRIEGLTVNRVEGREVVPVFSADVLRNRGRQLVLEHCRVYEDGRTNVVGKAELKRTPSPVLVWHGGTRCLDDLVVKVKESK